MNETTIEIPIIRKLYELYKLFYGYLELFPKKDRYNLGARCEGYILDTLELLLAASSVAREDKKHYIIRASVKFDTLKVFLRMAKELRLLDNKKYLELQKHIQETGKMLGGWQRSLE